VVFKFIEKVEIITVAGTNKAARTFDCAVDLKNDELICSKVMCSMAKLWQLDFLKIIISLQ